MSLRKFVPLLALLAAGITAPAQAGLVTWNINSTQSFVRLAIPDFLFPVEGIGNATVRIRNADNAAWSDAGGRRAFLSGTVQTQYIDKTLNPSGNGQIDFLEGTHNIFAVDSFNLRPNPAAWNPGATDANNPDGQYSNTSGNASLFDFGAKIRGTVTIIIPITVDVAFLGIDDVLLDIVSGNIVLPGAGLSIPASSSNFGIDSALIYADGVSSVAGQLIPDIYQEPIGDISSLNTSSGSIAVTSTFGRTLTYGVNVPIAFVVEGFTINGTATGQIVATAVVPEPSAVVLMWMGGLALAWAAVRRRKRRST